MFLHISVSHSVHREVCMSASGSVGVHPLDTTPVKMTVEVGGMHPTGQPLTSG